MIAYGRSFASGKKHLIGGKREQLPTELVAALTTEERRLHKDLLTQRNRHISHRDNDLEQILVSVLLNAPPLPPQAVGVAPLIVRFTAPPDDEIREFGAVAERLYELLSTLIRELSGRLVAEANEDLLHAYGRAYPRYRVKAVPRRDWP